MKISEMFSKNELYVIRWCHISQRRWKGLLIVLMCLLGAGTIASGCYAWYLGRQVERDYDIELDSGTYVAEIYANSVLMGLPGDEFSIYIRLKNQEKYWNLAEGYFETLLLLVIVYLFFQRRKTYGILMKLRDAYEDELDARQEARKGGCHADDIS